MLDRFAHKFRHIWIESKGRSHDDDIVLLSIPDVKMRCPAVPWPPEQKSLRRVCRTAEVPPGKQQPDRDHHEGHADQESKGLLPTESRVPADAEGVRKERQKRQEYSE